MGFKNKILIMKIYKIAQQMELPEIEKEVPTRTEKDALNDYAEDEINAVSDVLSEFVNSEPGTKQQWDLVPFARVKKIWEDYMRMGFVRDEKGVDKIAQKMINMLLTEI